MILTSLTSRFKTRNALYGFSSTRNSLDLCHQREKDNESLLQVEYHFSFSSWLTKESVPGQQPPGRSLQPRSVQGGDFRQPVSPHRKWTRVIIGVTGCKQIHV